MAKRGKKKVKRTMKFGIIMAVLALAIGFALLTTTLRINGTIHITPDNEDCEKNIKFTDASFEGISGYVPNGGTHNNTTTLSISEDGKTLEFSTGNLMNVNEGIEILYKVNNGSNYDAEIGNLVCTSENLDWESTSDPEYKDYLNVQPMNVFSTRYTGANLLLHHTTTSETDSVRITLKKSYVGTETPESPEVPQTKQFKIKCKMVVTCK